MATKRNASPTLTALRSARGEWQPVDYSARLLIPDRRIAVASDVHIPYHNEKLLAYFLDHCRDEGMQSIVWLGDLLDLPTFSSWGRTDYSTLYQRELGITRRVIEMAAERVDAQYWSRGNHEERILRRLDRQIGMREIALMAGLGGLLEAGTLLVSDNPTLDAAWHAGKPTWMLTHPAKYGRSPLAFPGQLALRYQQNVMSAHAHHWGMGTDPTGRYLVVETGGFFDSRYHEYVNHRVTGHRAWASGYWFLTDAHPQGFLGKEMVA